MRTIGKKNTVLLGLGFQLLQLVWYSFGSEPWSVPPPCKSLPVCPPPSLPALIARTVQDDVGGGDGGGHVVHYLPGGVGSGVAQRLTRPAG